MPNYCLLTRLFVVVSLIYSNIICSSCLGWDPSSKKDISDTEQLQDQAVRFIGGIIIMGRDGVEDAKTKLGLFPLHKRTRDQRLRLLMHIIAKGKHHSSLSELYNEIITNQQRL